MLGLKKIIKATKMTVLTSQVGMMYSTTMVKLSSGRLDMNIYLLLVKFKQNTNVKKILFQLKTSVQDIPSVGSTIKSKDLHTCSTM